MEEEVPAPERMGARNEEAAAAVAAQTAPVNEVPVVETPEMTAPGWLEDLREVAPNVASGADGPFANIASTSEGGLGAGPSEGSSQGANWAIIQPEVPSDFVRAEREEDDAWQAQLNVSAEIEINIARSLQLNKEMNFSISNVSASLVTCPFLIVFVWHPLTSSCSQQLMLMSHDKSVKLAQLYSRVNWLERYNASLGVRLNEANAQVSPLDVRNRALELELARANGERDAQRAAAEQKAQEVEEQAAEYGRTRWHSR